jgi:tRNA G18 (ribose-2'-O)-methylase SpoU
MSEQEATIEETEVTQTGMLVNLSATALYKAEDVKDQDLILTIEGMKQRTFEDGQKAWILVFAEEGPGLRLNKVNQAKLIEIMGSGKIDDMIGRQIRLYYDKNVMMGSKKVGGVRIERAEDLAGL